MIPLLLSLMAGWLLGCACALALYVRIEWRRRRAIEAAKRQQRAPSPHERYCYVCERPSCTGMMAGGLWTCERCMDAQLEITS